MTKPYTSDQVRAYIRKIPIDLYNGLVESLMPDLLELLDEYYKAGYDRGYQRGLEDAFSGL